MNYQVAVGVGHRFANPAKELAALSDGQAAFPAELLDWLPFDVLHHEVRAAVGGGAPIDEARDIGMIETGENLAFVAKPAQDPVGIDTALDHLYGDASFKSLVRAH